MSKVAMVIKSKTQPEKREAVRQRYEKHLAPRTEATAAQELVLWCADTMDADAFYLFEVTAIKLQRKPTPRPPGSGITCGKYNRCWPVNRKWRSPRPSGPKD